MKSKTLLLLSLATLISCSHMTARGPASQRPLDLRIAETEKLLENLKALQSHSQPMAFIDYIDSGINQTGRQFDIFAEVLSNEFSAVEKVEVYNDGHRSWNLELVRENNRVMIKDTVPWKLPLKKVVLRVTFENQAFVDLELACTRAKCN